MGTGQGRIRGGFTEKALTRGEAGASLSPIAPLVAIANPLRFPCLKHLIGVERDALRRPPIPTTIPINPRGLRVAASGGLFLA